MAIPPTDISLRHTGLVPLSEERERIQAGRAALQDPAAVAQREADAKQASRHRDLLSRAMDHWRQVEEAERDQRRREKEDLQFARGLTEDQWPEDIRRLRAGGIEGGVAVPARPTLTINRLKQPVSQVINEARQARLSIIIKAKGEGATTEGAELRQGLIRAIEVDSNAQAARLWALDRAVKCGRGYYRILTEYANDGDFDLDIRIAPIKHQGSVYMDPGAREWDGSDAQWAFITEDVPRAEFRRRFGRDAPEGSLFESETDVPAEWIDGDHIRVAEYWYVEAEDRELVYDPRLAALGIPDGKAFRDALPPDWQDDPFGGTKTRQVRQRRVYWTLITATEVLEEREWPGRYIPIIPVLGEIHDVDGHEITLKGMVTDAKDAQRSYNYMRSSQVEQIGLAPRVPFVMAGGQQTGYEQMWAQANVRNFPYLLYNPTDFNGQLLPPPQRLPPGEMGIEAVTMAVREAESDIKATTGRFDPSLGQMSGERSGRAIRELKAQGETGSSHFLEQLATISMPHEARILLDLLPIVYDRPGRLARLLGEEEQDEETIVLGVPFVPGPDGRPVPLPPGAARPAGPGRPGMPPAGMLPPGMPMPGAPPAPRPKLYRLDDGGSYSVAISVGKAVQTQREANLEVIQSMIEATKGQVAPLLVDIWAEMLDGPMSRRIAERFRKMNPQLAAAAGEGPPPVPPQVQAQMQQMQQQIQQMGQALQQAQQELATQQAKVQAEIETAKMEMASRERIAALQTQADLIKTRATLDAKAGIEALKLAEARFETLAKAHADERYTQIDHAEKRRDKALEAALSAVLPPPVPPPGAAVEPAWAPGAPASPIPPEVSE